MSRRDEVKKKRAHMQRMRRKRRLHTIWMVCLLVIIIGGITGCVLVLRQTGAVNMPLPYTLEENMEIVSDIDPLKATAFAQDLCVGEGNVELEALNGMVLDDGQAAALFNLDDKKVVYAKNMYNKLYPASMTKIMTALLALENGDLAQTVTISESAVTLEEGSQVCGFVAGDQVSLDQLVHCLLIYSGNDAAAAIAETIGGSLDQFVILMNQKAAALGMTGTHFTNPHGLQDENHYTTAYDIYLMLNEAMKNQTFLSIIQMDSYTVDYEGSDGTEKSTTLTATDHYLTGETSAPKGVTVLGGKTGTTGEAGNCLALLSQNAYGLPYISIISKASSKDLLYQQMNLLLNNVNNS